MSNDNANTNTEGHAGINIYLWPVCTRYKVNIQYELTYSEISFIGIKKNVALQI